MDIKNFIEQKSISSFVESIKQKSEIALSLVKDNIPLAHLVESHGISGIIEYFKRTDKVKTSDLIILSYLTVNKNHRKNMLEKDNLKIINILRENFVSPLEIQKIGYAFYNIGKEKPPYASHDNIQFKINKKRAIRLSITNEEKTFLNPFSDLPVKIVGDDVSIAILSQAHKKRNISKDVNPMIVKLDNYDNSVVGPDSYLNQLYSPLQIAKINKGFTLYHELAHLSLNQQFLNYSSMFNENMSDISSVLKLIKEFDMDERASVNLVNDIIKWRSHTTFYSNFFEEDSDQKSIDHFTVMGLLELKNLIQNEFSKINNVLDLDIPIFSQVIARYSLHPLKIETLRCQLGVSNVHSTLYENVSKEIEKNGFLKNLADYFLALQKDSHSDTQKLVNNLVDNIKKNDIIACCFGLKKKVIEDPFFVEKLEIPIPSTKHIFQYIEDLKKNTLLQYSLNENFSSKELREQSNIIELEKRKKFQLI